MVLLVSLGLPLATFLPRHANAGVLLDQFSPTDGTSSAAIGRASDLNVAQTVRVGITGQLARI